MLCSLCGVKDGFVATHWQAAARTLALAVAPYAAVVAVAGTFSPFLYFQF